MQYEMKNNFDTMIKYIGLLLLILFGLYILRTFKKLPNNTQVNKYHNSRYYRILGVVIICVICLIYFLLKDLGAF